MNSKTNTYLSDGSSSKLKPKHIIPKGISLLLKVFEEKEPMFFFPKTSTTEPVKVMYLAL